MPIGRKAEGQRDVQIMILLYFIAQSQIGVCPGQPELRSSGLNNAGHQTEHI